MRQEYRNSVMLAFRVNKRFLIAASAAILLTVTAILPRLSAQKSGKPATRDEIIGLLESGVDPPQVEDLVRQYGVAFELTPEAEKLLRDSGATDELISAIREHGPHAANTKPAVPAKPPPTNTAPPASPVLIIQFSPGGGEVYIDDEPVGTTSPEGRLKLSHLAPGRHTVRLAHAGYQDHEQNVELANGQTADVTGALEPSKPAEQAMPPLVTVPTLPTTQANPGYLGVAFPQNQTARAHGVVISGVAPGSPADQAGLRPQNIIWAVDGHAVNSPEGLRQEISAHRAGEIVRLTVRDGTQNVVKRVQLAAAPASGQGQTLSSQYPAPVPGPSSGPASQPAQPHGPGLFQARFYVYHDHGEPPPSKNYCVGVLSIGEGLVQFRSTNSNHAVDLPIGEIKEARRNSVYLMAFGAFHIRMKRGRVFNFIAINKDGQFQPPGPIVNALDHALNK